MSITDKINAGLDALFEIENDAIYKSLICDKDGTNPTTITKPTDIQLGALTSQIEYLRRLSMSLAKQIYIDQASGDFLEWTLNNFFNSLRMEDETDAAWVSRTISTVLQPKVSRAAIIYALRPYSTAEPELSSVNVESAYSDFTYADCYITDLPQLCLPAISDDYDSYYFTVKVKLYNTDPSAIWSVYQILSLFFAAGITYFLEIVASIYYAYYPFDDALDLGIDVSGNSNNATAVNLLPITGGGATFNGINGYLKSNKFPESPIGYEFEFKIKFPSSEVGAAEVFFSATNISETKFLALFIANPGYIGCQLSIDQLNQEVIFFSIISVEAEKWYEFKLSIIDSQNLTLNLDGTDYSASFSSIQIPDSGFLNKSLYIGTLEPQFFPYFFKGDMDFFRFKKIE